MMRWWAMTGLGLGCLPGAPGTFGSAGAIVVALGVWAAHRAAGTPAIVPDAAWVVLTVLAGTGCVKWGPWAVVYFAARAGKPGDPRQVVLDEFAGQWLALLAIPMPTFERALAVLGLQFFLFRLFDVIKPPPARRLEKLPAGWGILSDDLAAAVYANILGQIVFRLLAAA